MLRQGAGPQHIHTAPLHLGATLPAVTRGPGEEGCSQRPPNPRACCAVPGPSQPQHSQHSCQACLWMLRVHRAPDPLPGMTSPPSKGPATTHMAQTQRCKPASGLRPTSPSGWDGEPARPRAGVQELSAAAVSSPPLMPTGWWRGTPTYLPQAGPTAVRCALPCTGTAAVPGRAWDRGPSSHFCVCRAARDEPRLNIVTARLAM